MLCAACDGDMIQTSEAGQTPARQQSAPLHRLTGEAPKPDPNPDVAAAGCPPEFQHSRVMMPFGAQACETSFDMPPKRIKCGFLEGLLILAFEGLLAGRAMQFCVHHHLPEQSGVLIGF